MKKINLKKTKEVFREIHLKNRYALPSCIGAVLVGALYLYSQGQNQETHVFHYKEKVNLQGGEIISNGREVYERQEKINSNKVKKIETSIKDLYASIKKIENFISNIPEKDESPETQEKEKKKNEAIPNLEQGEDESSTQKDSSGSEGEKPYYNQQNSKYRAGQIPTSSYEGVKPLNGGRFSAKFSSRSRRGPSIISFPVTSTKSPQRMGVKLPAGSFLKAKLLTGVEANETRPVPVLLQADFSFVGPNRSKIDLSGCFIIAKSKGNLSIERVEMQASRISCVSKSGRMFDIEFNGYVADSVDSSFGVIGEVNSKQDRVATMGFLSSIVQGVGSAIQTAQTTAQATPLGGSTSVITGDQTKHMLAGGASNAASLVTNWYLKQAQNLLPTINIGSGQDVWIVVNETVDLPSWYFKREKKSAKGLGRYSYLSRFND